MCTAFIRPRAQSGIARCPAIHSSEADTVQLIPAKAVTGRNIQTFGTMAIKTRTATRMTPAEIVRAFGLTILRQELAALRAEIATLRKFVRIL